LNSLDFSLTNRMPFCEKHQIESIYKCKKCTVEKREQTMVSRYGVRSALHSKQIKERKDATCLQLFGNVVVSKTEEMKNKVIETNLKKHGVKHTLQIQEVREKGKETMKQLYGVEYAIQNPEIKQKRVETNIQKFGVENALQNQDILNKRKETNILRFGTDEVFKNAEVQEKIKATMIETYGSANPLQCQEIKERKDATCEVRYGDKDIMKNPEIFEKVVQNSFKKKQYKLPSGRIIIYQGYENIALDELLKTVNEDEFTNDVKLMPCIMYSLNNKMHRYYPDIYIPSQNKFIEVKSPYTYNRQLAQNECKAAQVIKDGYSFEFWICSKTDILEIKQYE